MTSDVRVRHERFVLPLCGRPETHARIAVSHSVVARGFLKDGKYSCGGEHVTALSSRTQNHSDQFHRICAERIRVFAKLKHVELPLPRLDLANE